MDLTCLRRGLLSLPLWSRVKEGEFKGFSVEGVFDFPEEKDEQILEALKEVLSKFVMFFLLLLLRLKIDITKLYLLMP